MSVSRGRILPGHEYPDDAGREDDGLRFSQRGEFLAHHQQVGEDEYNDRGVAAPVVCQVEGMHEIAPVRVSDARILCPVFGARI